MLIARMLEFGSSCPKIFTSVEPGPKNLSLNACRNSVFLKVDNSSHGSMCSKSLPKTHQPLSFLPLSRQKVGRSRVGGWCCVVRKDSDRESSDFDIDQDKAREALRQLDLQLESLSRKKIPSPKIKASEVKWTREEMTSKESAEERLLSGSFLSYAAIGLLLFTILYNLLFYSVIKPSIDGPEYFSEIPTNTLSPPEEVSDSPTVATMM